MYASLSLSLSLSLPLSPSLPPSLPPSIHDMRIYVCYIYSNIHESECRAALHHLNRCAVRSKPRPSYTRKTYNFGPPFVRASGWAAPHSLNGRLWKQTLKLTGNRTILKVIQKSDEPVEILGALD